jgi:acyl-CoA synthetase (AMP-forming)/AMP-acid ligase II
MGDIGVLREDGNLRLIARTKQVFRSGGYNIYPREIELALESHPAAKLAAVVPRPDPAYRDDSAGSLLLPRRQRRLVAATETTAPARCCYWATAGRPRPGERSSPDSGDPAGLR